MASSDIKYTDVLVCGAGPVGLLIALGLAQQGIDTRIIGSSPCFHMTTTNMRNMLSFLDNKQRKEEKARMKSKAEPPLLCRAA